MNEFTNVSEDAIDDTNQSSEPRTDHELPDSNIKAVERVIYSEIGVVTLLNRLKQSIASAKEFATFLKKRSSIEEEHSNGLKKLCRTTNESIRKPDHRQGTFLTACGDVTNTHEQIADNGAKFALALHEIHDDLSEMATGMERSRKYWKNSGMAAEQRAADSETAVKKAKAKYDTLADDYDRARTGDRQSGKLLRLKSTKSAAQYEEDILRKLTAADGEYAMRVQAAQTLRTDLWLKSRPETVKALEDLIKECDSALTLQVQKFASLYEKLLLSNGLSVSPLKNTQVGNQSRSLRDAVHAIDNDRDLTEYILGCSSQVPSRISEIKYQRNSVLNQTMPTHRTQDSVTSFLFKHGPSQTSATMPPSNKNSTSAQQYPQETVPSTKQHERVTSHGTISQHDVEPMREVQQTSTTQYSNHSGPFTSTEPPQISSLSLHPSKTPPLSSPLQSSSISNFVGHSRNTNLPPLNPVFGLSLNRLSERDGSAVPMVVYQCIQAVDLFGLEVEGIYRLSGTASHVSKIKSLFDNDASKVDFRDPANFFHDVNSVAGLLKLFFRDLPDPLLTSAYYADFIEASKLENEILCRDSLHAIINNLPEPNYATLRAVILHLNRVQENSTVNRMNISNLAIVFGPSLMGANTGSNIQNAGWQVKVVDTILQNCFQIFEDD